MGKIYFMCVIRFLSYLFMVLLVFVPQGGVGASTISIGILVATSGTYQPFGQEAIRGAEIALAETKNKLANRSIELVIENTDGTSDGLIQAIRRLAKRDDVHVIVGPLTGYEGVLLKNIALKMPNITFVNGSSASPDMTLDNPANNLFRYSADITQWLGGLGSYAYRNKGYRKIITLGEKYSYPFMQVFSFSKEFCSAGGHIVSYQWVFPSRESYLEIVNKIKSSDVDAIFLALDGDDAVDFVKLYRESGGDLPIVGGPTSINTRFLSYASKVTRNKLDILTSGPIPLKNDLKSWSQFVDSYRSFYNSESKEPSIFSYSYYVNLKAVLIAIDSIEGQLPGNNQDFREELSELELMTPTGEVTLDKNRQAVVNNYIFELITNDEGIAKRSLVHTYENIEQRLGFSEGEWLVKESNSINEKGCHIVR